MCEKFRFGNFMEGGLVNPKSNRKLELLQYDFQLFLIVI